MNDTCLGDDGVETVASALANGAAPVLEELEMELNEITVTGAEPLAAALAVKTGLKKVNLKENSFEKLIIRSYICTRIEERLLTR